MIHREIHVDMFIGKIGKSAMKEMNATHPSEHRIHEITAMRRVLILVDALCSGAALSHMTRNLDFNAAGNIDDTVLSFVSRGPQVRYLSSIPAA